MIPSARSRRRVDLLVAHPGWMDVRPFDGDGCRVRVLRTRDRLTGRLRRADAVVFHIPTTPRPIALPRRPGQPWIAWSMESEANYPQLADPGFMAQFELTMTYRQIADVPVTYCGSRWLEFEPGDVEKADREAAPAVYLASSSHNKSGRAEYVRELMRHMPVDSYGASLNNRVLVDDRGSVTKLATIARYRFTLAFENSICDDYVTEKFFDPLWVGSVPVYLGAANVSEFAPAAHSYIDVRDFSGPPELARFLLGLSRDEERYREYLSWRGRPLDARFLARASQGQVPNWLRLRDALPGGS